MGGHQRRLFEALVREHAQALDLFLRALLRDPGDVDDVFQEALIVAWRRLADYDPERRFGPWIRGIARRIALHRAHAAGARPVLTLDAAAIDALEARIVHVESLPGEAMEDRLEHVGRCVEALPERMRDALRYRYDDELGANAIGERLGLTGPNARKVLERARARVADCIRRRLAVMGGTT
ncbi:MAG: sigma-70 family RNA polymerase sigma factor [Planctomycetota bacterium]